MHRGSRTRARSTHTHTHTHTGVAARARAAHTHTHTHRGSRTHAWARVHGHIVGQVSPASSFLEAYQDCLFFLVFFSKKFVLFFLLSSREMKKVLDIPDIEVARLRSRVGV